jgi:hypothetical protein
MPIAKSSTRKSLHFSRSENWKKERSKLLFYRAILRVAARQTP